MSTEKSLTPAPQHDDERDVGGYASEQSNGNSALESDKEKDLLAQHAEDPALSKKMCLVNNVRSTAHFGLPLALLKFCPSFKSLLFVSPGHHRARLDTLPHQAVLSQRFRVIKLYFMLSRPTRPADQALS